MNDDIRPQLDYLASCGQLFLVLTSTTCLSRGMLIGYCTFVLVNSVDTLQRNHLNGEISAPNSTKSESNPQTLFVFTLSPCYKKALSRHIRLWFPICPYSAQQWWLLHIFSLTTAIRWPRALNRAKLLPTVSLIITRPSAFPRLFQPFMLYVSIYMYLCDTYAVKFPNLAKATYNYRNLYSLFARW